MPPFSGRVASLVVASLLALSPTARAAEPPPLKIAVITTLGGADEPYGRALLDGVRLALDEANGDGGPRLQLDVQDDGHKDDTARQIADRIVAGDAQAVIGPLYSTSSLAAGPTFAKAGLASIVPEASSDLVTDNATTFRTTFKNSDVGESLAVYLRYALNAGHAAIVFLDNGYGRTVADGFKRGAERLGLPVTYHGYGDAAELDEALRAIAADPAKPAVVLATFDEDSVTALKVLRRSGFTAPAINTSGVSDEAFLARFANEPEVRDDPGFFTRNFYSVMPVMIDSANALTISFMEYADSRLPGDRPDVPSTLVQAYDAARLTIAAVRQSAAMAPNGDIAARRAAVLKYLRSLDTPARGLPGLLGPLWFGPDRGRDLPMRVGVFRRGRLVSAPLQLVPVRVVAPDPDEIASGAVLETAPGHYVRRQQVVYTGIYLNEVSRIDIAQSTFTADFYVWMRFPQGVATDEADPTQIEFPGLVRGTFDSKRPDAHRDFGDGTTYRLWRVNGEFKDDFDLHGYPADSHVLNVRFLNARASSNRLVYVVDRGSADWGQEPRPGVSARAFRNLSQWQAGRVLESRDALLTQSALGRPDLLGAQRQRELSGFDLRIEVHRRIGTTLIKTLLPVGLMTLILFATFYFPAALASARVMVGITAALSGTVLMTAINSQLGNVGYVIAAEYGFYAFFALCLICIITALVSEQRRVVEKPEQAVIVDRYGRYVFVAGLTATILAGIGVVWFGW